ncbi:MAG: SUMF1/EgtB/PvdO family nonheme iron enzyme [Treponema sp.]|jgi:formylglycine-generating enzyme required for sulfatase activity|nr:SUMF1/EgtB/PvdO family nonheme iron enzyme [Treponema sp.]
MKRIITVIAVLTAALLVFGCDFFLGPDKAVGRGNLVIAFGENGGRVAVPTPEEQAALRYELVLTGPGGQIKNVSLSPGKIFNEQAALGEWHIYAEAYKPGDVLAGRGSATVTVRAGINQARIRMEPVEVFVAVTDITGVPTGGTAGTNLALSGTVAPANATNQTIVWSVNQGETTAAGAEINSGVLSTSGAGTVVVTATIANGTAVGTGYTQNFSITINAAFVAVTDITGVATSGTVGVSLLSGTVVPANATNKTITWSVNNAGTTGAGIGGNSLSTSTAGTVVVTATIVNGTAVGTNYTQDFSITINPPAGAQMTRTISGKSVPFRYVPAGSFQRNGTAGNNSDITNGYWMGETEVTQELFQAVMGANPSNFISGADSGEVQNQRPVEKVSWYEAIAFCNKLSLLDGKEPVYSVSGITDWAGLVYSATPEDSAIPTSNNTTWNAVVTDTSKNGYRLPTEAEWMWAAMGADTTSQPNTTGYSKAFAGHDGSNSINGYAWYSGNSSDKTHEVGKKAANELGLYDMSGNVQEWCWDLMAATRVIRGGSFGVTDTMCTVAASIGGVPFGREITYGFRVVCGQ